ncbi:Bromodomain-containing protein [Gigaspora margarita]|uniref:Bromodomain-containing protein n=1 Tax=Gigaspora margarita TaxID=4874 RepID=A0A8H4EIE0_GIGMA|nr:Bromodomain-containing protein [Gigaspora margarita]
MAKSKKQTTKSQGAETSQSSTNNNSRFQSSWFKESMGREHHKHCAAALKPLKHHSSAAPFLEPVDYVKYNIPDYPDIIKNPMDLGTVEQKLNDCAYESVNAFISDVRLVFSNCIIYNGAGHQFSAYAKELDNLFTQQLMKMPGVKEEIPQKPVAEPSSKGTKTCKPVVESPAAKPTISDVKRPKRTIKAPAKDLPDVPAARRKKIKKNTDVAFCREVVRELRKKIHWHYAYPFYEPVDAAKLGVPDYYRIITRPMDLSTINTKLENDHYVNADEFEADIRLMFQNCYTYNGPGSDVYNMGKELEKVFDRKWAERPKVQARQESESESEADESDHLKALQKHLAALSSQISQMRKPSKAKAKKAAKSAKPSTTKSIPDNIKPVEDGKKSLKRPRTTSKREEQEGLTSEQKADLSERIELLSTEKMNELIRLIEESGAPMERGSGGYEIEIESLDYNTAKKMYDFVLRHTSKRANHKKRGPPSKKPRTNANEKEQEQKILALERTLAKFDHKSPTPSPQAKYGSHYSSDDDSSDSQSSDSSGSESEDSEISKKKNRPAKRRKTTVTNPKPKGKAKAQIQNISPTSTQTLSQNSPRTEPPPSPPKEEKRIIPQEMIDNYEPWVLPTERKLTWEQVYSELYYGPLRKADEERRRREEEQFRLARETAETIKRQQKQQEKEAEDKRRREAEIQKLRSAAKAKRLEESEKTPFDFYGPLNEMNEFYRTHGQYIDRGHKKIRAEFGPPIPELPYTATHNPTHFNIDPLQTRLLNKARNPPKSQDNDQMQSLYVYSKVSGCHKST